MGPLPNNIPENEEIERKSKGPSPFLNGNNEPTFTEGTFNVQPKGGVVPKDLVGHFTRVGPNPRFDTTDASYHPFDGDGMVHCMSFSNGTVQYSKKWIRTKKFTQAESKGFDIFPFGEISEGIFQNQHYVHDDHGEPMGTANTNIVAHQQRAYALYESDKPYRFNLSFDSAKNLETVGREDFAGQLHHPVAAHPKVDYRTNELMLFGYLVGDSPPTVSYSVVHPDLRIKSSLKIPIPHSVLMHDMIITENYSILCDINFQFQAALAFQGKSPWVHVKDVPARFGIFPRHIKDVSEVVWVDVEPFGLFHFANAWEENGKIYIYGCKSENMDVGFETKAMTRMHEWVLDIASGKCLSARNLSDHIVDFPQVDQTRQGYKTRYLYAVEFDYGKGSEARLFPEFKSIVKYDLKLNQTTTHSPMSFDGNPVRVSESCFCPRASRDNLDESQEDLGYIACFAHDETTNKSECLLLDARTMTPEVHLCLPERVPNGFHASWIHSKLPLSKL